MTTIQDRIQWLASLKVGDKVLANTKRLSIWGGWYGNQDFTISKITSKRTKFTLVDIEGNEYFFNKDGWRHSGSTFDHMSPRSYENLQIMSEETKKSRVESKICNLLNTLDSFKRYDFISNMRTDEVGALLEKVESLDSWIEGFRKVKKS